MKYIKYHHLMMKNPRYKDENPLSNIGDQVYMVAIDELFSTFGISEDMVIYTPNDNLQSLHNTSGIFPCYLGILDGNKLPFPSGIRPYFFSTVVYYHDLDKHSEMLKYLKMYEPIGCRDDTSKKVLESFGIKCYLTGCASICFPKRKKEPEHGKVFFVDVPQEIFSYVPEEYLDDSVRLTHAVPFKEYPVTQEEDIRLKNVAKQYLNRYRDEARLMITGRLHAALPAMAMGIPTILIRDNYDFRFEWVDKYLPLYTVEDIDKINWNPEPVDVSYAREHFTSYMRKVLLQEDGIEEELQALDKFYSDRKKTPTNKRLRECVHQAANRMGKDDFTYAIWGAGAHGQFIYDIVCELYPKAKLVTVVDKFVEGQKFGTDVIRGEEIHKYEYDHLFVTTNPGKNEAIDKMKELFGEQAQQKYSICTSMMTS